MTAWYAVSLSPFYIGLAGLFGLLVGSFINVVVLRVYSGESIQGRSHCVHCNHTLAWFELVPLFSYLGLQGKCRMCSKHISWQYPLVELATGAVFAIIAFWFSDQPVMAVTYMVIASFLVVIFVFDAKYFLIPDLFTIPVFCIALVGSWWFGMGWQSLGLGVVVGAGVFAFQYVISRGQWIGGGDIRLGAVMGAILGFPNVVVALFLAYLLGAAVAVPLLVRRNKGMKDHLPFGTFLTLATFITMLVGDELVQWYIHDILQFP